MNTAAPLEAQYGIYDRLGDYRLFPVFQNTTADLRAQIVDLWRRNNALPAGADPDARAKQVVILAVDTQDKPIGVSTVYRDTLTHAGVKNAPEGDFYFFRTFVQPGDRAHNLPKKLTTRTYDYLKTYADADKPKGVIIVAENPKLTKALLEHQLGPFGWVHIGADARGKQVFRRDF